MDDLVFYFEGIPSAIIVPSTIFNFQKGKIAINGPLGVAYANPEDDLAFQKALSEAGSLVPGEVDEVLQVKGLLANPETSRTVSYLLCSAKKCGDVIEDLKALAKSKVLVAGCGGIGSSLSMLLAGAGIKNFLLVDADIIEKSNLNRQLFWTLNDVGNKKVDVLKSALESRFEGLNIDVLDRTSSIEDLCELASSDITAAAVTADNPATLARESWKISESCKIPVVSGGYLHHICLSFDFLPEEYRYLKEKDAESESEEWLRLPSAIMPSYGPMNFSLASQLSANLISSIAKCTFGLKSTSVNSWDSRSLSKV
ncbi:ThiF family adenylyltransferase [Pseudomonas fragariae (ex Marin et al. 2024)]|uniref:THIF-type NAD/FAD binding fold domain-containing protein n=1 Tax=Pseudomonas syringae pv. apii TaxID=81036 RepID=A0A3M5WEX7_9PSED|nr:MULTISPECIES: ThiF family adenylyltransferase [Pseudomonas]AKF48248.1 Dinucleotide-utilizing enzymes involved in molybdopterin and thiamine biosynthesis family 2 [Pseudomonas syringae pv. syringae B301D]EXL30807.1 UBA/THIF-type NAD/FAD binding domain-containing protein [Pseudomonas syringae pv. syringae str. B301D-R]MCA5969976.1 ThiF family adenylyltransferase [Pseudomonas sp. P129]MCH5552089.1 ThiF family adenylyltransferase [Pseudomonas syringae pv. syringae]RMU69086.1 hypothetical protei